MFVKSVVPYRAQLTLTVDILCILRESCIKDIRRYVISFNSSRIKGKKIDEEDSTRAIEHGVDQGHGLMRDSGVKPKRS